jgi:hypothetical protein
MEIVVLFLARENEAEKLRKTYSRGWPELKLSKLFTTDLFIPLHSLLSNDAKPISYDELLDKSLFVDPELNNLELMEAGEAFGVYVKRVNPGFVKLLSKITTKKTPALAREWYASKEVTEFYRDHGWTEQQAYHESLRILTELIGFAKKAMKEKKAIMQIFSL